MVSRVRQPSVVGLVSGCGLFTMSGTELSDSTGRLPDRRKLIAVAHMDMAGYSRLIGLDDQGTLNRLRKLRRSLIDPAIAEHGGRVVQTAGDSLLIVFDSIDGAVRCAVKVQEQVPIHDSDQPKDRAIRFRVGINLGDAIADGTDLHGDAVNVAARIQAECPPGGICVTRPVRDHVRDRLALVFEELGPLNLKNIARPVEAFMVRPTEKIKSPTVALNAAPITTKPSIAVMAFTNIGGDPEQEYFSDGIADDIITELSRISYFFVIARNSSFTYRGRALDVRKVAHELGVRYVLEGGVRRSAERLRLTAQLVDAETGNHIWADRYERPVGDLFALQDEIAAAVAKAIRPAIAGAELRRALRKPPGSLDAWEAYQRGLWHLLTDRLEDIPRARAYFLAALDSDPTLSGAYTGLAWLQIAEAGTFGLLPFEEASRLGAEQARKAVSADPNDADAHAMLAFALSNLRNWKGVSDHVERALAISPSCARAYHVRGMNLVFNGHPAEARSDLFLALQLDPHRAGWPLVQIALSYYFERDYEKAIEVLKGMIADNPSNPLPHRWLAASFGQLGQMEEARSALEMAMTLAPESFRRYTETRAPWFGPGDFEHMLDGLRKAGWQG
jgi:adenylate cyclase